MSEIKILLMILTLTSVHPLVLTWLMISIRKNRILRLIISHFTGSSGKNKISRKEDQQDFQQFEVRRGESSMRKTGLGWQSTKLPRSRERFLSCWTLSRLVGCNIDCLVAAVSFDRYKARLISKKKRKKKGKFINVSNQWCGIIDVRAWWKPWNVNRPLSYPI